MNLRQSVAWLTRNHTELEPTVTAEEVQQLDLLLGELAANEQHLTPAYWANRAQAFTDHVALLESSKRAERATRLSQLKPYLVSALPLGGLIALGVALTTPTVSSPPPAATNEAAPHEATTMIVEEVPQNKPTFSTPQDPGPSPQAARQATVAREPEPAMAKRQDRGARKAANRRVNAGGGSAQASTLEALRLPPAKTDVATTTQIAPPEIASSANATPATPPKAATRDTFSEQLAALKRADKALKSGDNRGAKAALSRTFSPQLTLHANALRAVLACQTHDVTSGRRYLSAQAKSHPNSPYLERMRRACGVK